MNTTWTHKYKRGERVSYVYFSAAMSCQSSRRITGQGRITRMPYANGVRMYEIDGDVLVYEPEIKRRLIPDKGR
jgi:hypothetical protein